MPSLAILLRGALLAAIVLVPFVHFQIHATYLDQAPQIYHDRPTIGPIDPSANGEEARLDRLVPFLRELRDGGLDLSLRQQLR